MLIELARKETDRRDEEAHRRAAVADEDRRKRPTTSWKFWASHERSPRSSSLGVLASSTAFAQQPNFVNARIVARAAQPDVARAIAAIAKAQVEPAWIGYAVPALNNDSFGRSDGWSERCRLEQQRVDPATNAPVPGPIRLEPAPNLMVLVRLQTSEIRRVRSLSGDCQVDAGGLQVYLAGRRERRAERRFSQDARDSRYRSRAINPRARCRRWRSTATRRRRPRFSTSRRTARPGCASARSSGLRGAQNRRPPASLLRRSTTIPMSR